MTTMYLVCDFFLLEIRLYQLPEIRLSRYGKHPRGISKVLLLLSFFSYCQKTLRGHDDWVRAIEVTDDGTLLASAGHDKVIQNFSCVILNRPFVYGTSRNQK